TLRCQVLDTSGLAPSSLVGYTRSIRTQGMADRHDIDALLIGSLYGELSSADEARLKAHLESHPGDRTALDGLNRAREAVRASRDLGARPGPPASGPAPPLAGGRAPPAPQGPPRGERGRGLFRPPAPLLPHAPRDGRRDDARRGHRRRRH